MSNTINSLVKELTPIARLPSPIFRTATWLLPAVSVALFVMWYVQPFRDGIYEQLLSAPRFAFEILFGYLTSVLAITTGFVIAVPGAREEKMMRRLTHGCFLIWLALYVWTFYSSPLSIGMAGKREVCHYETIVLGFLLGVSLLIFHRRSVFLRKKLAALYIGIGCSFIPTITMQYACMYIPLHSLQYHFSPAAMTAVATFLVGNWLLRKA